MRLNWVENFTIESRNLKLCNEFKAVIWCMKAAFYRPHHQKPLMCPLIKRLGEAFVSKHATAQPSFWGFKRKLKARLSVWKTRSRVCIMTRPMLSQSATVTSQDIILAFFFLLISNFSFIQKYLTIFPLKLIT